MYVEGSQPTVHLCGAPKRGFLAKKKGHLKRLRLPTTACDREHYSTSWTLCGFRYGGIILRYLRSHFDTARIDASFIGTKSSESRFYAVKALPTSVLNFLRMMFSP